MVGWAIGGLIVSGLITVLVSLKQRKLYLSKLLLIVAAASIGVLVFNNQVSSNIPKSETAQYQEVSPSFSEAPYLVNTSSRAYYVSTYQEIPDGLLLTNYFYYNQKKWEASDKPLPLTEKLYGTITLSKRKGG